MPRGKKARKVDDDDDEGSNESDYIPEPKEKKKKPEKETQKEEPKPKEKKKPAKETHKEEAKTKGKRGKKPEPPAAPQPVQETSPLDIETFLKAHTGSSEIIEPLAALISNSSVPRALIAAAVETVFQVIEADSNQFEWGRSVIQSISTAILEPKKRLREAYFFPSPTSEQKVISHLLSATKTMIICVYSLTNDSMANAIRGAKAKGVDIRMIFDDEMMKNAGSDVQALYDEGFSVRIDIDPKAHMHNKFVIIDDRIVITGSYNWTKQASTKNHENVVIFEDVPIAELYTKEFNRLWEEFANSMKHEEGKKPEEKKSEAVVGVEAKSEVGKIEEKIEKSEEKVENIETSQKMEVDGKS